MISQNDNYNYINTRFKHDEVRTYFISELNFKQMLGWKSDWEFTIYNGIHDLIQFQDQPIKCTLKLNCITFTIYLKFIEESKSFWKSIDWKNM